jgi:hypothetical protein
LSTTWGSSPYATPTPVIDSVMRNQAPTPVPIPGFMPLAFPQVMAPPAPVPYLGVPPLGFPQLGFPPAPVPYLGMPQLGIPQLGIPQLGFPPAPVPYLGVPPLGFPQLGFPPAPVPYLGMPQLGMPQLGMPQLGITQAQALGLDMQATPWPTAGLGGHAISPVITMLLSQLGLREAVSRIGDEALKQRVTNSVNEAIDRTIEGLSGMTLHPWFGPGAQSMIYPIAAQLALIANRYQDGAVRNALLDIAGQILQTSIAPTGEGAGRHK